MVEGQYVAVCGAIAGVSGVQPAEPRQSRKFKAGCAERVGLPTWLWWGGGEGGCGTLVEASSWTAVVPPAPHALAVQNNNMPPDRPRTVGIIVNLARSQPAVCKLQPPVLWLPGLWAAPQQTDAADARESYNIVSQTAAVPADKSSHRASAARV